MKSVSKKLLVLVLVLVFLSTLSIGTAKAVEFDQDGIIGPEETVSDDVFLEGDAVVVDGTVHGVVFANANTVTVNGTINGDLLIFAAKAQVNGVINGNVAFVGQTLKIAGTVNGSVFGLGGAVWLQSRASVGRNLFFMGYALEAEPGSRIGMDVSMDAQQARLAGEVAGDVRGNTNGLQIEGKIGHNIDVTVGKPGVREYFMFPGFELPPAIESGIRVTDGGRVDGMVIYASPVKQHEALVGVPPDRIAFEHKLRENDPLEHLTPQERANLWVKDRLRDLVTLTVIGGLAWWLLPNAVRQAAAQVKRPLPALGWGVLVTVGGIAAAVVLALAVVVSSVLLGVVTLGGLAGAVWGLGISGLGFAFSGFLMLLLYGSKVVAASALGMWLCGKVAPKLCLHSFWAMLVGVILYVMVRGAFLLIGTGIGFLFDLVVTFLGMGACWLAWKASRAPRGDAPPTAPVLTAELRLEA